MPGKRQQIVNAIKARLAGITTANGYQTDIGLKQTEWNPGPKGADPEADELPGHDIRDEVEAAEVTNKNSGTFDRALEIVVIAELKEAGPGATLARQALEDLIQAVGIDPTWGGLGAAHAAGRRGHQRRRAGAADRRGPAQVQSRVQPPPVGGVKSEVTR